MKKSNSNWIYKTNKNNSARFSLGEKSSNMIACIGINPSTASPEKLDRTIESVKRIAYHNGHYGWVMFNLYPQRATNPDDLHQNPVLQLIQENEEVIRTTIELYQVRTVWFAFGDLIEKRMYLKDCYKQLTNLFKELNVTFKMLPNLTKKGYPRHPLYKKGNSDLVEFPQKTSNHG